MNTISKENGGNDAIGIFHIMAYFAPEDIRPSVFSCPLSFDEWNVAVNLLLKYSLVQPRSETMIRIEKNTQTKVRKHVKAAKKDIVVLKSALKVMLSAMQSFLSCDLCHAMSVLSFTKEYSELLEESSSLTNLVVINLNVMRRSSEAYSYGRKAFNDLIDKLGTHHPTLLELQYNLGGSLFMENKYTEALDLLLSLYEKESEVAGKRVINKTLETSINLIMEMESSPSFSPNIEARVRRIVFGRLPVHKTKDNSVLQTWITYADLLITLDSTSKALEILNNVVKRRKEILDPDDDDISEAMSSYAHALAKNKKFDKSLKTLQNAYDRRKRHFGEMNEKTIGTKFDTGIVFEMQGEYLKAVSIFEEIIEKSKHNLGENNLPCMRSEFKVAANYYKLGVYDKAYNISNTLYEKLIQAFGKTHQATLRCKQCIGNVLLKQDKTKEALKNFQELLEEYKGVYGPFDDEVIQLIIKIEHVQQLERSKISKPETIHILSMAGNLEKVTSLIQTGVEINSKDSDGNTPLHYAAEFGHLETVKLLLENGAKYNVNSDAGATPLQLSKTASMRQLLLEIEGLFEDSKNGNCEKVLKHISEESWIVNIKDKDGCATLHWAALGGHRAAVKLLLEFGADISLVSDKSNTALHIAASKGHCEIVESLVQSAGRDKLHDFINAKTETGGCTSLHVAAERGFSDVVKTLLSNGAVFSIQNKSGKTPLEVAEELNCRNLLKLVEGLFQDAKKGSADIICKLRDIDSSELFVVSRVRDSEKRTLLQVVTDGKHTNLARKLFKVFNYNDKN